MDKAQKIEKVLSRGVAEILPKKENLADLMSKKKIRLYLGIDPTATKLHLGHTINLRKLQEFADLGHEAILIIGTGTVLAGDPTLRDSARKKITEKEVKENIKTWKKQAGKVVDFSKVKIKYNGDWLKKLGFVEINEIASYISSIKLYQRSSFQKRLKKGDTVWTNETMYPLWQGYDSVYLDVDLEIGGTDQVFNMLMGRELQKKINNKEKFVLTSPMIVGTDNCQMSKTSGNCIWIEDAPQDMFGKIMSIPDELLESYTELLTGLDYDKDMNPKEAKVRLAKEIVKTYHNKKEADKAEEAFNNVFKNKGIPKDIPEITAEKKETPILNFLTEVGISSSNSDARRSIEQNAVKINGKLENDWKKIIKIEKGLIVQVGKRKFLKIK